MFQACQIYLQPKNNFRNTYFASLMCLIMGFFGTQAFGSESGQTTHPQKEKTYLAWEDVKCDNPNTPECYAQLKCNIEMKNDPYLKSCAEAQAAQFTVTWSNGYSKYDLRKNKTKTVIISIHGLWGDADQFKNILNGLWDRVRDHNLNLIHLTLPGHVKSSQFIDDDYREYLLTHKPSAKYQEWIQALENTLKIAKQMGDKVVIAGQSTGGLLAVIAALQYPQMVDSIVLIEPALQVRSLMDMGACLGKIVPSPIIRGLGSLIGMKIPEHVSIEMGCEVQKLSDIYFPRKYVQTNYGPKQDSRYIEDLSVYSQIAGKIKVPVLLINNENDSIVSARVNQYFYNGLNSKKQYIPINQDSKILHGAITWRDAVVVQYIVDFAVRTMPNSDLGHIYTDSLAKDIELSAKYTCSIIYSDRVICMNWNMIEFRLSAESSSSRLNTIKKTCDFFFKDPRDCQKLLDTEKVLEDFWTKKNQEYKKEGRYQDYSQLTPKDIFPIEKFNFRDYNTDNDPQVNEAYEYIMGLARQLREGMNAHE